MRPLPLGSFSFRTLPVLRVFFWCQILSHSYSFSIEVCSALTPSGRHLLRRTWRPLHNGNVDVGNQQAHDIQATQNFTSAKTPIIVSFLGGEIECSFHGSIGEIPEKVWDSCARKEQSEAGGTARSSAQHTSPFVEHAWLNCLEESSCASPETGWTPCHLSIRIRCSKDIPTEACKQSPQSPNDSDESGQVKVDGCVPMYIKNHSMGEFIFDDAWADAAFRNGWDYYPKLLIGVPFTPVTGSRLLWHPWVHDSFTEEEMADLVRAVAVCLQQRCALSKDPWSSVHVNFCTEKEATLIAGPLKRDEITTATCNTSIWASGVALTDNYSNGNKGTDKKEDRMTQRIEEMLRHGQQNLFTESLFLRRTSLQYHWRNYNPLQHGRPFVDFEDYLKCFRSKRRITIRRERAKARRNGAIRIDAIVGTNITQVEGLVERMFEIYVSTVNKFYWGRQYLTLDFFQRLCRTSFVRNLCFFCVRYEQQGDNVEEIGDDFLSCNMEDIFAGTFNVVKDEIFYGRYWGCLQNDSNLLHFETCYWSAIEYCIQHGLKRMEPGAGGGDYKWSRGFDPKIMHSVHYIGNPLLRAAISQYLESETDYNMAVLQHLLDNSAVAERPRANNPEA